MTIPAGTLLGPYEIRELRGKGGMGEVYRARDTRLDRDVAIKVLPEELSSDSAFKGRFEREAKTISQLQHPNVCTLYDVGSHEGRDYLVMELLEGKTLEERLKSGALSLDDVMSVGAAIAEAIEAAHRRGIVHRDLKPGNVMLTSSGVKVLDFGLAKEAESQAPSPDTQMATATRALSAEGSIVGTLHYMSPEQLEGKAADARSDVFALGVVLYEMACGVRPFRGDSQAGVIASILQSQPEPLTAKKPPAPKRLEWLIERCLKKDPGRRWQSAYDVAIELGGLTTGSEAAPARPRGWQTSRVAAACLVTLLVGLLAGRLVKGRPSGSAASSSSNSSIWRASDLDLGINTNLLVLSPDGERLLHGNSFEGLRLREMRSSATIPLPATAGVVSDWHDPSFDPDGKRLYYSDLEGQLHRVAVSRDAQPERLGPGLGGVQGEDGLLYYSSAAFGTNPELRRRRLGDTTESNAETLGNGGLFRGSLVPGGKGGYVVSPPQGAFAAPTISFLDFQSSLMQPVVEGNNPTYLPSGLLAFYNFGAIWAIQVDPETFLPLGQARPVERGVGERTSNRLGIFSLSRSGDLVYRAGSIGAEMRVATWTRRDGVSLGDVAPESGAFLSPKISPDGNTVGLTALAELDSGGATGEGWHLDLASGSWNRPVRPGTFNSGPGWVGAAGDELYILSNRGDRRVMNYFIEAAGGTAPAELLTRSTGNQLWLDASPDGRHVLLLAGRGPSAVDAVEGVSWYDRATEALTLLPSMGMPFSARFDPSGRFVAYAESTPNPGIWVQRFDSSGFEDDPSRAWGEPIQLTRGLDTEVAWSPSGDELYYRSPTHLMAIPIAIEGDSLEAGRPQELFEDRFERHRVIGYTNWAVHPDGRFLFLRAMEPEEARFVYIQNWRAKVEALFAEEGETSSGGG